MGLGIERSRQPTCEEMRNPWNAKRAGEHLTNAIRDRIEAAYVNGDQEEMDALEAEYDRYDRIHTYWEPDVSESSDEALFAGLTAACQASDDSLLHLLNLDGHSHVRLLWRVRASQKTWRLPHTRLGLLNSVENTRLRYIGITMNHYKPICGEMIQVDIFVKWVGSTTN